jgi:UDP-3-O-[3-hydroxymyristoyl] N-acetylglucosamine deacetylase/3-hydroxyacyl-[acyl-carrier-protein] dehydratase
VSGDPAGEAPRQQTIGNPFALEGTGLHSGQPANAEVRPADADTGIVFRRSDLRGEPTIKADVDLVSGVEWETVLGPEGGSVRTVEHLLAALAAHDIDNAEILLRGSEPPARDGSSADWCEAIEKSGIVQQDAEASSIEVREAFSVEDGPSRYTVSPHDGYRVSAEIDFEHPVIRRQFASAEINAETFCADVAPARTFGLQSWAKGLHARGLALGASLQNTIALTDDGIADGIELRFVDEFVRHKIIDIVGDLALAGCRLRAHVVAERPSHRGNVMVARRLRRLRFKPSDGSPVLEAERIFDFLPHRYPFLLVDRILEFEPGRRILGLKNVTINEPFFNGHFPGHPIMPGVLIVEGMAQTGGLLMMNEVSDAASKVVYFMSMNDVKFRRPVHPGDQLLFDVEMLQFRGRVCRIRGVGTVGGQVVAEATLMAQVVDR